ncbi:MAG TPA: EamA family transporter [Puia sp.]|nr:EamA family transporter [Puia sp.]
MKRGLRLWLAFAAIYIIWGTTYLAIKIGIEFIPPYIMASLRYLIAGGLLLLFCLLKGESIFASNVRQEIILGAFIMTFGQATAFWAEKYISSGLTAVFNSLLPVCYIISDKRNWSNYGKSKLTIVSIVLGIIGIVILFISPAAASETHTGFITVIASVITVIACFCWAAGSLYYKYHEKTGSLFANVGWQLIGGMICCIIISAIAGEWTNFHYQTVPWNACGAVLYLAIAGSIVALIALYWLLERRPAAVVGTYAYVNPVIAVLLGYFIANERISLIQIFGMIVILIAAYIANQVKFATGNG